MVSQHDEGLAHAGPFDTPQKAIWLYQHARVKDALIELGEKAGIKFPDPEKRESPSKRHHSPAHDIKHRFTVLFFTDRQILERELEDFIEYLPALTDHDDKLEYLLRRLTIACESTIKQKTPGSRPQWPPLSLQEANKDRGESAFAPPSPTMTIKHAPKVGAVDAIDLNLEVPHASQEAISPATSICSSLDGANDAPTQQTDFGLSSPQTRAAFEEVNNVDDTGTRTGQHEAQPANAAQMHASLPEYQHAQEHQRITRAQTHDAQRKQRLQKRVAEIPQYGLTHIKLPPSFHQLRFDLQWEVQRVVQTGKLSFAEIEEIWRSPRTMASLHKLVKERRMPFQNSCEVRLDGNGKLDFSGITLYAKMRWNRAEEGPVFYLELQPLRREDSNSFQREFGPDRLLYIDVPSLFVPPDETGLGKLRTEISDAFQELLGSEQSLLGRKWAQFLVQPKNPTFSDEDFAKPGAHQFTFFAVSGPGMRRISIAKVVNWQVPLRKNAYQPSCKAYARLDLAASRTKATLVLKESEICFVEDLQPTDTLDDSTYNDANLTFPTGKLGEPMSDGCCKISRWAMTEIARLLGLAYVPSVIQARIFGAKGVWYIDDDVLDPNGKRPETLIWIAKSQVKVKQTLEEDDSKEKLTINVVAWSKPARPSVLFPDLLPIMIDRGVPKSAVSQIIHQQVDLSHKEFLDALDDGIDLWRWIHAQRNFRSDRDRDQGIEETAGFPKRREEKLACALASGFQPTQCHWVADEVNQCAKQMLKLESKNTKLPVPNATMVYGIADPKDCLEPGEIHISFSEPFREGSVLPLNVSALVARLPALGASDIQRVRIVCKPQLAHIKDVVVFSAKGPRSLASKLQGGDYDGDRYWICWQDLLVRDFRNAPAPTPNTFAKVLDIKVSDDKLTEKTIMNKLGIKVNETTLGTAVRMSSMAGISDDSVGDWIRANTKMRMRFDLLGKITLTYGQLIYHDNNLTSDGAMVLLCLHDLMIDADKRGLSFYKKDFEDLMQRHGIAQMQTPAHRIYTGATDSIGGNAFAKRNPENIVDYVFFEILEPKVKATLALTEKKLSTAVTEDAGLTKSYDDELRNTPPDSAIGKEVAALPKKFEALRKMWWEMRNEWKAGNCEWDFCLEECRAMYVAIVPDDAKLFSRWLETIGDELSMWDKLKASALARLQHTGKMMFNMAGRELCEIKALRSGPTRRLTMRCILESKPRGKKRGADRMDDDDDEFGDAIDHWDGATLGT